MIKSKVLPTIEMSSFSSYGHPGSLVLNIFDAGNNHSLSPKINLRNSEGEAVGNFTAIPPGLYDLTLSKYGYFDNHSQINVANAKNNTYNLSMAKKNLGSSGLTVSMTWVDGYNLDLHVLFKTNTTESCHVFFNHKQCGGAKLDSFSLDGGSSGGEAIKLVAGPSYYLFYAKAPEGENNKGKLSQSKAHIDVYSSAAD